MHERCASPRVIATRNMRAPGVAAHVMALASSVFTAVFPLVMSSADPIQSPQPDTLTVHINIVIDRAMRSNVTRRMAMSEATAIWALYGVELVWSDSDCGAALDLDVVVGGRERGTVLDGS